MVTASTPPMAAVTSWGQEKLAEIAATCFSASPSVGSTSFTISIVAVAGAGKRELLGKNLSPQLEQIMEQRSIYQYHSGQERLPVSESAGQYAAAVAAPILCGGDVLGLVLFVSAEDRLPGEGEYKLAQAVAGFLGKHMEA